MSDIKKSANEWVKFVDEKSDQVVKLFNEGTKDFSGTVKKERKKMEIKSQIGEHTRALNKAYTRLGEAYYNSKTAGKSEPANMQDVMDLIRSNRKVVELLNDQLEALEGESK